MHILICIKLLYTCFKETFTCKSLLRYSLECLYERNTLAELHFFWGKGLDLVSLPLLEKLRDLIKKKVFETAFPLHEVRKPEGQHKTEEYSC